MHKTFALALCALLAGCGTIMNGGPFMVPVTSHPQGATVVYRGAAVGKTPCTIAMGTDDTLLRFRLDGHRDRDLEVSTATNWWYLGNAVFLVPGFIGLGYDLANGATTQVETGSVSVSLPRL
jgi:hypothetical protein